MKSSRPTGSVIICVLVALLVVVGLATSMVKTALQGRQAIRNERQLVQVELLVEAGILRGTKQLRADAQYEGEVWQLAPDAIPGTGAARVEIKVDRADETSPPNIEVVARLGDDPHRVIQRSYTFTLSDEE